MRVCVCLGEGKGYDFFKICPGSLVSTGKTCKIIDVVFIISAKVLNIHKLNM